METGVALEQMLHAAHMYHVGCECVTVSAAYGNLGLRKGFHTKGSCRSPSAFLWGEPIVMCEGIWGPSAMIGCIIVIVTLTITMIMSLPMSLPMPFDTRRRRDSVSPEDRGPWAGGIFDSPDPTDT